jgi:two-component system sensor histidine kinase KdpD
MRPDANESHAPARPSRAIPSKRPVETEAAEITKQTRVTGSEWADEGVSAAAAAETDAADVVEAAGHFRIYLGSAAGVGKTYAMLSEGQRRQGRGTDVVIGFVECHGRRLTEELIGSLEVIPRKAVGYRGSRLEEMDLDAVLRRRPKIALVDELAHTNVPGSGRHDKRWQDVLELLGAGIDVITTVNIQHLESIADEVEHMTGAKVRERVPDRVVRKASQIELVDSSPEQLRRRMLHGNIYPKERVSQALTHFFRTDNLTALRELALRFLADETDEELLKHLRQHESPVLWETTERIMVAVTAAPGHDVLLRRAARMAARARGELDVVHVIAGDTSRPGDRRSIDQLRQLAVDLGARWHQIQDDDPARAIASFARQHQITQIVIGSSRRSRWQQLTGGGSNVQRVIREAGAFGIDVHVIARRELPPAEAFEASAARSPDTAEVTLSAERGSLPGTTGQKRLPAG